MLDAVWEWQVVDGGQAGDARVEDGVALGTDEFEDVDFRACVALAGERVDDGVGAVAASFVAESLPDDTGVEHGFGRVALVAAEGVEPADHELDVGALHVSVSFRVAGMGSGPGRGRSRASAERGGANACVCSIRAIVFSRECCAVLRRSNVSRARAGSYAPGGALDKQGRASGSPARSGAGSAQAPSCRRPDLGCDLGRFALEQFCELRTDGAGFAAERPKDLVGYPFVLAHGEQQMFGVGAAVAEALRMFARGLEHALGPRRDAQRRGLAGVSGPDDAVDLLCDVPGRNAEAGHRGLPPLRWTGVG
jgi:hypothetical protein